MFLASVENHLGKSHISLQPNIDLIFRLNLDPA